MLLIFARSVCRLILPLLYGVSVAQIIQKAARAEESAEVVVITAQVREGDFRTAMEELSGRSSVRKISSMLRVYGE